MSLEEKKARLIEDLSFIEDPYERFAYVIDAAKTNPGLSDDLKIEVFKVEGCTSNLWLVPEYTDGRCVFRTDADSSITKGIATLLSEFYSGEAPGDIIGEPPDFLGEVGITQHLSANRRNGLTQIWKRIESFANSCLQESGGKN